jgi:hypothetical protein
MALALVSLPALNFLLVHLVPKRWRGPSTANNTKTPVTPYSSHKDEDTLIKDSTVSSYELGEFGSEH